MQFLTKTIDFQINDDLSHSSDDYALKSSSTHEESKKFKQRKQKDVLSIASCSSSINCDQTKRRKIAPVEEVYLKEDKVVQEDDTEISQMSFFKSILPLVINFDDDQTIDFQMGVLRVIRDVKKKKQNQNTLLDSEAGNYSRNINSNSSYYVSAISPPENSSYSLQGDLNHADTSPANSSVFSEAADFKEVL